MTFNDHLKNAVEIDVESQPSLPSAVAFGDSEEPLRGAQTERDRRWHRARNRKTRQEFSCTSGQVDQLLRAGALRVDTLPQL
jgi:hypothetical protein